VVGAALSGCQCRSGSARRAHGEPGDTDLDLDIDVDDDDVSPENDVDLGGDDDLGVDAGDDDKEDEH